MEPDEQPSELRHLFDQAADLAPSDRRAWLERLSRSHGALAAEIGRMLGDELPRIEPVVCFDADAPDDAPVPPAFAPGESIESPVGPAVVEACLSATTRDGLSEVYEITLHAGGARAALKVLRAESSGREMRRRFRREAATLAQLDHPGISRLIGAGACRGAGGIEHPAIVTALVRGVSLDRWAEGRGPAAVARAVAEVARSVHFANLLGVVHRDLKPSNVMVDETGRTHILDLGVAKILDAGPPADDALASLGETVVGTLRYMAPEQITPTTRAVTPRADVYALGVVLHELVTGAPPVDVAGLAPAEALERKLAALPVIPRSTGQVRRILECAAVACAAEPRRRHESCAQFAEEVDAAVEGLPSRVRPPGRVRRLRMAIARRPVLSAMAMLAALAIMTAMGVQVIKQREVNAQRFRAQARFDESRAFVRWVVFEHDGRLSSIPGTAGARRALIDEAAATLDRMSIDPAAEDDFLLDLAEARIRLAEVLISQIGDDPAARGQLDAAHAALGRLRDPSRPLAVLLRTWAGVQHKYADAPVSWEENRRILEHALAVFGALETQLPADARPPRWRSFAASHLSRVMLHFDEPPEAVRSMLDAAIAAAERAVTIDPGDPPNRQTLADAVFWRAHAEFDLATPAALGCAEEALALAEGLDASGHLMGPFLRSRAQSLTARVLSSEGRHDEARRVARLSVASADRALASDPDNKIHFRNAEVARGFLAEICRAAARDGSTDAAREGLAAAHEASDLFARRLARGWVQWQEAHYPQEQAALIAELVELCAAGDSAEQPTRE